LTDSWAQRRFSICFRNIETLQPASLRMVDDLVERAQGAPAT
jgi:hypothetical protein